MACKLTTELAVTIMVAARRLTFWKLSDNDKHKNSSLTWKNAENLLFLKPRLESDGQVCVAPMKSIMAPPNRLETHQHHANLINGDLHGWKTFLLVNCKEEEDGGD